MELQRARSHVPAITAALTVVSLALVFGAVLGVIPAGSLPRASTGVLDVIPHVNAVVSTVAIGTILAGVRYIRRGDVAEHRAMMLASLALFVTFLVLYLYKVAVSGTTRFGGPDAVYQFVYLPTLAIHMVLAIVCIPLLYYVLLLAVTRPVEDLYDTSHRRIGRVAASLWVVSFFLGNVVYVLLYWAY
jgi:putative membrane protein